MPLHDPLTEAPRENPRGAAPVPPPVSTGRSGDPPEAEPPPPDEEVSSEAAPPDEGDGHQDAEAAPQDSEAALQDTPTPFRDTPDPHQDSEAALQDTPTPFRDTPTPVQDRAADLPDASPSQGRPSTLTAPPSTSRRPGPPLLASQALIEDLAPVEPLGQHARILCVVAGVLFALFGALSLLGAQLHHHPALVPSLVVGAVTLFAAVARVTYRKRAVAMVALGAIVAGLGIAGTGPAQGIAEGGAVWSLLRFVAATALPAALLFRARYRAFEGARLLLGLAFLTALPYGIHALGLVIDPVSGIAQLGAILALVLLVAGLPGFMGSETTAAGSFTAPAMIAAFALQAGLQRLGALVPGTLSEVFGVVETVHEDGEIVHAIPALSTSAATLRDALVTAIAFAASALLSALGLFQILAWKFAPAARKIDVRRLPEEVEERPSIEEWSTRG